MYTLYVIGIILFILLFCIKREYYHFLSKEETKAFFREDRDNYLKDLTPLDIRAQKSKSKQDYQHKIIQSASEFTPVQKHILLQAMTDADKILERISLKGFNGRKARNIKWKLALTKGNIYEDGLPHTRLDTIFISDGLLNLPKDILFPFLPHKK